MIPYPYPCESCTKSRCPYRTCEDYRKYINTKWMQYRFYPVRTARKKGVSMNTFTYEHPDRIRAYLMKHPCEGCMRGNDCIEPCKRYLNWYDARMVWFRRRFSQ